MTFEDINEELDRRRRDREARVAQDRVANAAKVEQLRSGNIAAEYYSPNGLDIQRAPFLSNDCRALLLGMVESINASPNKPRPRSIPRILASSKFLGNTVFADIQSDTKGFFSGPDKSKTMWHVVVVDHISSEQSWDTYRHFKEFSTVFADATIRCGGRYVDRGDGNEGKVRFRERTASTGDSLKRPPADYDVLRNSVLDVLSELDVRWVG